MANISNSVLCDEIDYIAAVAKAMATIYTATYDAFDFMVREQNPDDLKDGVDAAILVRARLDAGQGAYSQFSNMTQWLALRASAAGSSSIDGLLTARGLRAPYSYDQYVFYPAGTTHISPRNIFYDTDIALGGFVYGGSFIASEELTVSGSHNWTVLEVANAGGVASPWVVSCSVNYGDGTTGTERVAFAGTETLGVQKDVGANPINGFSEAGGYQLTLQAGTTGMVAGQYVLLVDNSYPVAISANIATGAGSMTVDPAQIGWYTPGDEIWIKDTASTETGMVENINYEYGTVTLATATAKAYTTANNAFFWKSTAAGDGFQEAHAIASVTGTDLVFSGPLQHSYYTSGKAVRMVRKVLGISTHTGGSSGYDVHIQTKSERTISQ